MKRRDDVDENSPDFAELDGFVVARGGEDAGLAALFDPLLNSFDILFIKDTNAGDRQERERRDER